jgi:autotransporter passenger strand-loop-strand repeat protein
VVSSGGSEVVASGGLATATTIGAFGTLSLLSGGMASGGIDFAGSYAALVIGGATMPTTPISGLAVSDTITLTDIPYDSAGTATLNSTNDVLTVTEGGNSYALQLAGDLTGLAFNLSDAPSSTTITIGLAPPTVTTTSEITNGEPTISGTALPNSTVTLLADGSPIGSSTQGTDAFAVTATTPLALGPNSLTTTATTLVNGTPVTSAPSTPVSVFDVEAPVNGISTSDFSSADIGAQLNQGAKLAFISGTEAVVLVDGILSVGPDTNEATLQRLYEGFLGRGGEPAGMSYYDAKLTAGVSKATVATEMMHDPEYIAKYGTQTPTQLVTRLYQGMLGRAPDPAGLAGWTAALAQGTSPGAVAIGIADSAEAKTYLAAATAQVFVPNAAGTLAHELYETGLGREVELAAMPNYQAAYLTQTPAQIAAGIAASPEFLADHAAQSNSDYVTSLYSNGIGRTPEPGGLASWTAALSSGALTRGAVLLDIATSSEAAAHLTYNPSA